MRYLEAAAVRIMAALVLAGVATFAAASQEPVPPEPQAEFDVASIRPSPPDRPRRPPEIEELLWSVERPQNGRLRMLGVSVRLLIQRAYDVKSFQIVEGPAWVSSAHYDVEARAGGAATFEQMRPMLRALLADRFKLVLRRETRSLPVFELVPARGGLKITAMKEGGCVTLGPDSPPPTLSLPSEPMPNVCGWFRRVFLVPPPVPVERLEGAGVSLSVLLAALSLEVGRTVIDRTDFRDEFSFRLDFASRASSVDLPAAPPGREPGGVADARSAPLLLDALREQLGLELRPGRGPVDVLVISQVERPSEN